MLYQKNVFKLLGNEINMLTDEQGQNYVSVDNLSDAIGFQKDFLLVRANKYNAELIMTGNMVIPESFITTDKVSDLLNSINVRDIRNDQIRKELIKFQTFGSIPIRTWNKTQIYNNEELNRLLDETKSNNVNPVYKTEDNINV